MQQGFPGGSVEKNPPAMQETQEIRVQSLGWEDPLEEGMATHSSILAWRIPWREEPGGLQSVGLQRLGHDWSDWARMRARMWQLVIDQCAQDAAPSYVYSQTFLYFSVRLTMSLFTKPVVP